MTEQPERSDGDQPTWKGIPGVFCFQIVALVLFGWIFRHALNPDAVAYLRIASYYADGRMELAISGHWSPLISWLLIPLLKSGLPPLAAGRVFMGFSAVVFLAGSLWLFRCCRLERRFLLAGSWLAALVSIPWSVENITPDLLLAGLVAFACAELASPDWKAKPVRAFSNGLLWGIAFLCKSVALPLGLMLFALTTVLHFRLKKESRSRIGFNLCLALSGLACVSIPWIATLSRHYGRFTVTTSAAYNHSLAGPAVAHPTYVLDQGFRRPEAGRVTIWEDPPLPYADWSPFDGWRNARQQLNVIGGNLIIAVMMLTGVSLAFPLLAGLPLMVCWRRGSQAMNFPDGTWALIPVFCLTTFYLPGHLLIYEQRYFYPAFPLLFVVAATMLSDDHTVLKSAVRRYGIVLLTLCFLLPTILRAGFHLNSSRQAGMCAEDLARRISRAGISGPIAGSGRMPGGRAGLYTAYLLDQPWVGDELQPDAAAFLRSGARLAMVGRGTPLAKEFDSQRQFQNLDAALFASTAEATSFPLQVFEILPP